jgi:hypothetical protein
MTYIIYNPDSSIKTFLDQIEDTVLAPGETAEQSELSFQEYAERFVLSHDGMSCMTGIAHMGDPEVVIDVSAPGVETVFVDINGVANFVSLSNGRGSLTLPTSAPASFALAPSDRHTYSAAGSGGLLVLVLAAV